MLFKGVVVLDRFLQPQVRALVLLCDARDCVKVRWRNPASLQPEPSQMKPKPQPEPKLEPETEPELELSRSQSQS